MPIIVKLQTKPACFTPCFQSTNFCTSARDAFQLVLRNLGRVVVLDSVCDLLLFLGKLVVALLCGCLSFLAFQGHIPQLRDRLPALHYLLTPVLAITIGSYLVASTFFSVYSMAVDTVFLCFLEDLERNDGSKERPFFMSSSLRRVIGRMERTARRQRSWCSYII